MAIFSPFRKNSATYKFAFAKTLIELIDTETTSITLKDLAVPFAIHIVEHLKLKGTNSTLYLQSCWITDSTSLPSSQEDYYTKNLLEASSLNS
jgi:hypothetical protein